MTLRDMRHRSTQSVHRFEAQQDARIREVLRRYRFDPAAIRIEHPTHARGFSGAIIVRISAEEGDRVESDSMAAPCGFCLRGWPNSGLPHRRLIELHRLLRFVLQQGVTVVPVPLRAAEGATLVTCGGREWQLEPWMPGVADFHRRPTDARLRSTMHVLARLHEVASRYEPTSAGREWFAAGMSAPSPAVCERLALVEDWTEHRLQEAARRMTDDSVRGFAEVAGEIIDRFRSFRERIRSELRKMLQTAVPLHPCLRDVWHDHVLFAEDDVSGLIDPSAARTENVAADLSRLLGSLLGVWGARHEAALDLYGEVRKLSPHERKLVQVLQTSGAFLSGMTWVQRRIAGRIANTMMPAVVDRLRGIRDQIGH